MHHAPTPLAALHRDVLQGAAIGAGAGTLFAESLGGAGVLIGASAVLGFWTGAVCGLLLWVSATEFPAAPIPPVHGPTLRPVNAERQERDAAGAVPDGDRHVGSR
jgi:hypothetical protein